jgi:hypothetical protein
MNDKRPVPVIVIAILAGVVILAIVAGLALFVIG